MSDSHDHEHDHEHDHPHEHPEGEWRWQLAASLLCGALGIAAALAGVPALWLAAYVAGAWFPFHEVLEKLRHRVLDVHFLMLAVAAGSASIGAWGEGAVLLFLFSLAGALEHYAEGRTQREIRALFKDAPKTATILGDADAETALPVEALEPGMRLRVRPGEQFPVDAEILSGETAADESNLTGEAVPIDKQRGDSIYAGTLNLWGAVTARVARPARESALQRIIALIHDAQRHKAPSQRFTDKFSTRYTYGVLALSLAMFFVWWLAFGLEPFRAGVGGQSAFYRTMTLLVVSSPCALVLSIPSAVLAAIAWGARRGILFRGGGAVEQLAEVDTVAMDKTGTLTTGDLRVEEVESFPAGRAEEVATLAYALERLSGHPLARAVTRHGRQRDLPVIELEGFVSVTGKGLEATRNGIPVRLGRRDWIAADQAPSPAADDPGASELWLTHDGLTGRIVLRDDIRPEAAALVEDLRRAGLRSLVLTGDRDAAAEHLQKTMRLDEVRSGLHPEQKVEAVEALTAAGHKVAFIGDGVNDAASIAVAHVGVAMGARGSDAALEQAGIVLMHDRLDNFLAALHLSRQARRIIRQNLIVSLGAVALLVCGALFGLIPLTIGVIGHEGSTVIVVLNSLRLLFFKPDSATAAG